MSESEKTTEEGTKEPTIGDLLEKFRDKMDVFAIPMGGGAPFGNTEGAETPSQDEEGEEAPVPEHLVSFDKTPQQVKEYLDRFVIGQDEAKRTLSVAICDHYNHVKRSFSAGHDASALPGSEYVKQNVILLGPTGVGKTYLLRILAQLIGVPFVKADVTKFSETGYVGQDVDDLVRELVRAADGNVDLAAHGIIFLDEIDKISSAPTSFGRDPSGRGVQVGLLKLMEETEVALRSPMDIGAQFQEMMQTRKGGRARGTVNTRHILFVVSGAFSGLNEVIEKRLSERNVGFGAMSDGDAEGGGGLLARVGTQDFVEYGFEPEFIGRLPVRVALDELSEDDLYRILTTSEGSILRQYRQSFEDYGLSVAFGDDALRATAARAVEEKTGARGLMSVLEASLRSFKFYLPGGAVTSFAMTTDVVENPAHALRTVRDDPDAAAAAFNRFAVEEFELEFARLHGVRLRLDDASIAMAGALSEELDVPIKAYLMRVFGEHADFLAKISEQAGLDELPVTPQILNSPGKGVEAWM